MQTEISTIAIKQQGLLINEYPEQEKYGGDLFLGKNYAKNNIIFLGINPGLDEECEFVTKLHDRNFLLDGGSKIRYWNNAAFALGQNHKLKEKLELSTFSFCCPFRTPTWAGLNAQKIKVLTRYSKPIIEKLLLDCSPDIIIVAGRASINILFRSYRDIFKENKEVETIKVDRFHQWSQHTATVNGKAVRIIQAPHFSYASNKEKLTQFNTWLYSKVFS